jgi:hypothetical protein
MYGKSLRWTNHSLHGGEETPSEFDSILITNCKEEMMEYILYTCPPTRFARMCSRTAPSPPQHCYRREGKVSVHCKARHIRILAYSTDQATYFY